jgi:D-tyrosyl-tRNA(Tyr) deacylase
VRAVLQRVSRAAVRVEGEVTGAIGVGLLALIGVAAGDGAADVAYIANKIRDLRVFPDEAGKMNRSLVDVNGAVLVVSQFTLMGDVRKGRRPAFDAAAPPDRARTTYDDVLSALRALGVPVEAGVFQADMQVELVNDGPVTILLDSRKGF